MSRIIPAYSFGLAMALAVGLVAAVFAVAVGSVGAQSAGADGEDFDPLFVRSVAPFDVAVRWLPPAPQVGFVNMAVKPMMAGTGEAVTDARVRIIARGEEREGVMARIAGESDPDFEVLAVNSPASPEVYRATMKFEEAGNWALRFEVVSPTVGESEFLAPIVVLPAPIPPGEQGLWAFLGIVAVLSAGSAYVVWSIRRAQASRRDSLPDPR